MAWGDFQRRDEDGDLVRIDIAPCDWSGETTHEFASHGEKLIDGCFCRPVLAEIVNDVELWHHNDIPRLAGS